MVGDPRRAWQPPFEIALGVGIVLRRRAIERALEFPDPGGFHQFGVGHAVEAFAAFADHDLEPVGTGDQSCGDVQGEFFKIVLAVHALRPSSLRGVDTA